MISVVIATYNGEKYIKEQLKSIYYQTKKVDQVIIKDDISKDNTVNICNDFIKEHNLENWQVIVNSSNMGFKTNFISGMKMAEGDIVFLCDQDDIWLENKVQIMTEIMEDNPNIKSLATTVSTFDNQGNILLEHLQHPNSKKNSLKQIRRKEFYEFSDYLGMTMAVRKSTIKKIRMKQNEYLSHDILTNYYAICMNGMYFYDKVLTKRRKHDKNLSVNVKKKELLEKFHGNKRLQELYTRRKKMEEFKKIDEENGWNLDNKMKKIMNNFENREKYIKANRWSSYAAGIFKLSGYESFREYLKDGKALLDNMLNGD